MNTRPLWPIAAYDLEAARETRRGKAWPLGLDRRIAFTGFLVFAGYYLGAKIGFALTFEPHPVSVMWPPNSILLAALLLSPSRSWWFLLLAAFPAHLAVELQGGVPLSMNLCWFASNSCEALIGAAATRFLIGPSARFDQIWDIGVLFLCGGLLGPWLSSFMDAAFVTLNHWGDHGYWQVWRERFCSNVFTGLTIAPAIVTWGARPVTSLRHAAPWRFIEAGAVYCGLLIITLRVFCWQENGPGTMPVLLYAPLPLLLWTAVRFGAAGTGTAIFSVALLAIWSAVHGRGPFVARSPEQNALSIQVFFAGVSASLMFLAVSVGERRQAEERFTKAFRLNPEAMIICRLKDGRIVEVNERWGKIFGHHRDEMVGLTVFDLNIYASSSDRESLLAGTSAGSGLHDLELSLRTKTGELRHTQISAVRESIGGEPCFIISIRDNTDRKRAEEAQQNLIHVSRLAVVGELTAMIAHEVNQPLGAILSNADAAEILLEGGNPPLDEIRQILTDIRRDDLRADEAIRRVRALLGRREMQMQALDLNEAIADVLRLVTGDALRRRVQVRKDLAPGLPLVLGDRVHLQQVLLNLIVNGMDAMNETSESARVVTVRSKRGGDGYVEVAVLDSGRGVDPEKLPRVFESFFTTKKDGMGLGLSIARSIIEAHQGRIWVENNPGGGAAFRFTVQVAKM